MTVNGIHRISSLKRKQSWPSQENDGYTVNTLRRSCLVLQLYWCLCQILSLGLTANRRGTADYGWDKTELHVLPLGLQLGTMNRGTAWWCMSLIPTLQNQRQADLHELEGMSIKFSQTYTVRDSLKKQTTTYKLEFAEKANIYVEDSADWLID